MTKPIPTDDEIAAMIVTPEFMDKVQSMKPKWVKHPEMRGIHVKAEVWLSDNCRQ